MSDKHDAFNNYMEYIVKHDNYKTLPCIYNAGGKITWVKPEKSCPQRAVWWDNRITDFKVSNRADVARLIHPKELKGLKPCSECGKNLSIFYIYPSKGLLDKINKTFSSTYSSYTQDIYSIIDIESQSKAKQVIEFFTKEFLIQLKFSDVEELKEYLYEHHTHLSQKGKKVGPGVMANPPDRLDGYHTYNACCRKEKDTGRHDDNMKGYTRDRRAFENWADGNFTLANSIMGEFNKYTKEVICPGCNQSKQMTADL